MEKRWGNVIVRLGLSRLDAVAFKGRVEIQSPLVFKMLEKRGGCPPEKYTIVNNVQISNTKR